MFSAHTGVVWATSAPKFPCCEGMACEEMPHGEGGIGDGHQLGITQDLLILRNSAVKDTSVILAQQSVL